MRKLTLIGLMALALLISACGSSSSGGTATGEENGDQPADKGLRVGFGQAPILSTTDDVSGYWLAGFSIVRPAEGIHDTISAVATVLDDGSYRLGIVVLDAFSLRYEDTLAIREAVAAALPGEDLDHLIVHAVHNHDVPDNNGMWSFLNLLNGTERKEEFRTRLQTAAVAAIVQAASNLQAADLYLGQDLDHDRLVVNNPERVDITGPEDSTGIDVLANPNPLGLTDLRPPFITDHGVRFAVFKSKTDGHVIGSIVNWGNHVETLWRYNQQISADFVGYLRTELSSKIGGTTLYITGNVGAVTTPDDEPEVFYNTTTNAYETINITTGIPYQGTVYSAADFDKAKAQGCAVADVVADAVQSGRMSLSSDNTIRLYRKDFEIGFQNPKFLLVWALGIMDREGHTDANGDKATSTEMDLAIIGDLWLLTIPGELYSEIAVGGIGVPPEGDEYDNLPIVNGQRVAVEIPALRTLMHGKVNMMMGLGNDHLGYLIPQSEWDEEKPFAFGYTKAPYGEENSLGPHAAGTIHALAKELLQAAGQ